MKTRKNHLPNGKHVATVTNEELRAILATYPRLAAVAQDAASELARRKQPHERKVSERHVPRNKDVPNWRATNVSSGSSRQADQHQPSNVKDAKKDTKKNRAG